MIPLFLFLLPLLSHSFRVVARHPHDRTCYTQGLQFLNNSIILESCGLYGQSKVHFIKSTDQMSKLKTRKMHASVFGEGSTRFGNSIYVLTWREKKVYVYNEELELQRTLAWEKDGWGLTHNDTHMFISDGGSSIYVVKEDFKILQTIDIKDEQGSPLFNINELELYHQGTLLANVYMRDIIVKIDINTGKVLNTFDLQNLRIEDTKMNALRRDCVLNGIAYNKNEQRLLVTGKMWSQIYEIQF